MPRTTDYPMGNAPVGHLEASIRRELEAYHSQIKLAEAAYSSGDRSAAALHTLTATRLFRAAHNTKHFQRTA